MLTPEALNALPGWTGVAFFLFWVIKALLDVIKGRGEAAAAKSEKSADKPSDASAKDARDLAIAIARTEVRLDHMEATIERMDDRLADIMRELGRAQGPR